VGVFILGAKSSNTSSNCAADLGLLRTPGYVAGPVWVVEVVRVLLWLVSLLCQ
jgi:hypothetical protein